MALLHLCPVREMKHKVCPHLQEGVQAGSLAGGLGVGGVASDAGDARHRQPHLAVARHNLRAVVVVVASQGAGQRLEHAQGLEVRRVQTHHSRTHGHHLQLLHCPADADSACSNSSNNSLLCHALLSLLMVPFVLATLPLNACLPISLFFLLFFLIYLYLVFISLSLSLVLIFMFFKFATRLFSFRGRCECGACQRYYVVERRGMRGSRQVV